MICLYTVWHHLNLRRYKL